MLLHPRSGPLTQSISDYVAKPDFARLGIVPEQIHRFTVEEIHRAIATRGGAAVNGFLFSSNAKLEQKHVAILDDIFFSLHPVDSFFARGSHGTAFYQIIVGDGFGFDEAAFEIRMDDAGGFGRSL